MPWRHKIRSHCCSRCCELPTGLGSAPESLQLPGIVLQSGEPDPAVLTDVAKTAIALDLPLELDEEEVHPRRNCSQASPIQPIDASWNSS